MNPEFKIQKLLLSSFCGPAAVRGAGREPYRSPKGWTRVAACPVCVRACVCARVRARECSGFGGCPQ